MPNSAKAGAARDCKMVNFTSVAVTSENWSNRLYPMVVPSEMRFHLPSIFASNLNFSTRWPTVIFSWSN